MEHEFKQWQIYLSIDDDTIYTLQENFWVIEQHIDLLIEQLYEKLTTFPGTSAFYANRLCWDSHRFVITVFVGTATDLLSSLLGQPPICYGLS